MFTAKLGKCMVVLLCFKVAFLPTIAGLCNCVDSVYDSEVEQGLIKSPDYPQMYCPGLDCTYEIQGSDGRAIEIEFESMSTERTHDYVLIKQILPDSDHTEITTDKLSGTSASNVPFVSAQGNGFKLHFHTDGSVQLNGWLARFRRFNVTQTRHACPRVYYEARTAELAVVSPNYPNLGGKMRCYFVFETKITHKAVTVTFTNLQITGREDQIVLFEADEPVGNQTRRQARPVKQLTATDELPDKYSSRGHRLLMMYQTARSEGAGGFRLTIKEDDSPCTCSTGQTIRAARDVVSPGYPNQDYCDDMMCIWSFECPNGQWAQFTVNQFETETHVDPVWLIDKNGDAEGPVQRWSGGVAPSSIYTISGSKAALNFTTDKTMTKKGFNISFDCVPACSQSCPQPQPYSKTTAPEKINTISALYLNQPADCPFMDCIYTIKPPDDGHHTLMMNVSIFPVEPDGFLELTPIARSRTGSVVRKMGTAERNTSIRYDRAKQVRVHYHSAEDGSTSSGNNRGFWINYQWLERCKCPKVGDDESELSTKNTAQNLTSPDYPQHYCDLARCTWVIRAPEGQRVRFRIWDLRTENQYDNLVLYEGEGSGKEQITRYSGMVSPYSASQRLMRLSEGNVMTVEFNSDSSVEYRGFRATYMAAPTTEPLDGDTETSDSGSDEGSGSGVGFWSVIGWLILIALIVTLIGGIVYYWRTGQNPIAVIATRRTLGSRPDTNFNVRTGISDDPLIEANTQPDQFSPAQQQMQVNLLD